MASSNVGIIMEYNRELEEQIEDVINAKWDAGDYDDEFVMWCGENGIHKDDAPDYEDYFLNRKFEEMMDQHYD